MSSKPQFNWEDPLFLEDQLNEEERLIRDADLPSAQAEERRAIRKGAEV